MSGNAVAGGGGGGGAGASELTNELISLLTNHPNGLTQEKVQEMLPKGLSLESLVDVINKLLFEVSRCTHSRSVHRQSLVGSYSF